jgi:hypothetical protein
MAYSVEYILNIVAKNTEAINKTSGKVEALTKKTGAANSALKKLGGIAVAYFGINKIANYVNQSVQAYERQMVAETKLQQVMRNTMNATDEQINSIKGLAAAQQKLGVVGSGIQLAGAQELGTYLTQTDSLKKLMPVMNDMLAQQYGINATQEQAVQIGAMMGKVMDGQVGALSRYGYKFTEAQERILKYGTEQQRVATLAQVITASVGGMNAALAATPEGKLKQAANRMSDIRARVGGMWVAVKSAWLPVGEYFGSLMDRMVNWFEANREKILGTVGKIANGVITAINAVGKVIGWVIDNLGWLIATVGAFIVIYKTATIVVSGFLAVGKSLACIIKIVKVGTMSWAAAQKVLNLVVAAHPVGAYSLAITALVGVVAGAVFLFRKFNAQQNIAAKLTGNVAAKIGVEQREMNKLFEALKKTAPKSEERKRLLQEMNDKYPDFLDYQKLEIANENDLEDARKKANDELKRSIWLKSLDEKKMNAAEQILSGEQKVYSAIAAYNAKWDGKLKNFVPYSDMQINEAMDKIRSVVLSKIDSGEFKPGVFRGASDILVSNVLDEVFGGYKSPSGQIMYREKLGKIQGVNWYGLVDTMLDNLYGVKVLEDFGKARGITDSVLNAGGRSSKPGGGGGADINRATESIVTGGTKSTNITINIGKLFEDMNFTATDMKKNVKDMQDEVLDALLRVLNMSQSAAM